MQENTGLTLSEAKGLLANLNDNLSGKDGAYWFEATKKLLRKEEIPPRPIEVIKAFNPLRVSAKEKLEKLVEYLMTIPVVHEVTICDEQEEGDLLNINVLPNLMAFIKGTIPKNADSPLFILRKSHGVILSTVTDSDNTDATFDNWSDDSYASIDEFCKELVGLGEMYEKSVPQIEAEQEDSSSSMAKLIFSQLAQELNLEFEPKSIIKKRPSTELWVKDFSDAYIWDWRYGLIALDPIETNIACAIQKIIDKCSNQKDVRKFNFSHMCVRASASSKSLEVYNYSENGLDRFNEWKKTNFRAFT